MKQPMQDQNSPTKTASSTTSPSNPSPTLSLDQLNEEQLRRLANLHQAFRTAALARQQGIDCDYFESPEEAALLPYLPLYRAEYNLPLVKG